MEPPSLKGYQPITLTTYHGLDDMSDFELDLDFFASCKSALKKGLKLQSETYSPQGLARRWKFP
jgi:hypothetical protein